MSDEMTVRRDRITSSWVAWYQGTVGVAITGVWAMLLAGSRVPEIAAGEIEIWFHLGAELMTAGLLIVAGIAWLQTGVRSWSGFALGALLYTSLNSAGYYAGSGDWAIVSMFGLLAIVTVIAALVTGRGSG